MDFTFRFDTFACPLVYGWYVVEILWLILYFLNSASTILLQKCVPLSLIMALGVPNLAKILVLTKSITTLVVLVLVAFDSTHLET